MNPIDQSEIAEALFKRGFLVKAVTDGFILREEAHRGDREDLTKILNELTIKHVWKSETLFINEELDETQYKKILHYPASNHETSTPMWVGTWKNFTRRKYGPKTRTIVLESGVAILVKALSTVGISTVSCCDGHGNRKPVIDFASYHNAIWFKYIQDKYLSDVQLHYDWIVELNHINLARLTVSGDKFIISLLQEDSSKMAKILLDVNEEICALKLRLFDKDKKPTNRLLKEKDFYTTKKIMDEIIKKQYDSF
ncbi:hypothetical protein [Halalkalibacter alkaliphilus]|uniref:Uncharacterized protein n=1 Tax=Halalkalibacter alkaliphilus TaxID=2917993 RepID=A0A9X2CVR2_9BACI|nr:hypothetical protein [Halalkalibacter alkaliphilus]MCL7748739.1 hypothetical protein [Halalkalibacter alkaliphilus]